MKIKNIEKIKPDIIYNLESLQFLKSLKPKSVDLIFSDLPYNTKKDYSVFQSIIKKNYYAYMQELIIECKRVSRKGIAIFINYENFNFFWKLLPDSHPIIIPHNHKQFNKKSNLIISYNIILTNIKPINKIDNMWLKLDKNKTDPEKIKLLEDKFDYYAKTPLSLTAQFLSYFSKQNNIVLDPFMGIGTTAVAAKLLNRLFIGCELNKKRIEISYQRLDLIEKFK
ncbi:MAG: site-specific DNA-methyltransferase [Candidatus Micrarchaeaceae archaeon]|nr:site-specific DNA-methyltransferase [Candidatus Marsarchaeota archaeon]